MKKLPIGESTFSELIHPGVLYVDKTEYLYNLIKSGRGRYFFSRPRRFGKSLTCSTFEAIFSGNRKLFKDLWIGQSDYEWKTYPIISFDFSQISHSTPEILERSLHDAINAHARKYSINLTEQELTARFAELINTLGNKLGPVVIIVDEYDKPIIKLADNPDLVERSRTILRNFYGILKAVEVDKNMHFLFVTGVSHFTKIAIFSELDNLCDLTNDKQTAALVGYTDQEVDNYLEKSIQAFANERQEPYSQVRQTLKAWYSGYRFSSIDITVYNPSSMHNCLVSKFLTNYWLSSGTTNFLMNFIKKNPTIATDSKKTVEGSFYAASNLKKFTANLYHQNYRTLLLETGYLTFISGYDKRRRGYIIGYPNEETRDSMTALCMPEITSQRR